jgi:ABC-type branched-subunit amino acid transport system substrate-binding protein
MFLKPRKAVFMMATLASAALGASVFLACSDDDGASSGGPTTPDGGGTDGPTGTQDDGGTTVNKCADAGVPARTCTAKACTQTNGGEPSVCVNDACVKLKSDECQFLSGPVDDDRAILMGSLLDQTGGDKINGAFRQNAIELAVAEINAAGGVPTADGCGSRPLVYVSCDDTKTSPDGGLGYPNRRRAANHLAVELKTAGVIGGNNSNNTVELSTNITNPAKALMIAPTAGASEITTVANATQDGTRMLWRVVPSDALQAKAVAKYGEKVAQELNKPTTLKVAIINRNDTFGNGLRDGVKQFFPVNGKPWTDASNTANVLERSYATTAPIDYATPLADLVAFRPDLIFWFGLGEITPNIIVPYEKTAGINQPQWVSSTSGQRAEMITAIRDDAAFKATGIQARVRGTSAQLTTALSQDFFNFRYKAKYAEPKTPSFGITQSYDAAYLIALAAAATKPTYAQVSSFDVAKGMSKTVGGTEIVNVGPTKLKAAMEKLRTGAAIDFNGASGALDFKPEVGEADGDYAIWCLRTDPNSSPPAPVFENVTGMTWKYQTNTLDGTFSCPQ